MKIKDKIYHCKECKIIIGWKSAVYGSGLCISCSHSGERHWNYIDGTSVSKEKCFCKDCGKELNERAIYCGTERCYDCANIVLGKQHRGKNHQNFKGGKKARKTYCRDCDTLLGDTAYYRGNKRCPSCAQLYLWKQEEHRNKTIKAQRKGMSQSPNKKEKQIRNILNKLFPKEYKFVGDGQVFINGFNPDFININGQKKLIEFYGDYWHTIRNAKERNKRRLQTYKKYGYKTLVIWESELVSDIEKVTEKIKEFHNDSM